MGESLEETHYLARRRAARQRMFLAHSRTRAWCDRDGHPTADFKRVSRAFSGTDELGLSITDQPEYQAFVRVASQES